MYAGYENLFKYPDKSRIGATLPVQGYVPADTMKLATGCMLRLLLLLAGANPEKAGRQAGWLAAGDWVWQKAGHTYIRDQRSALPVTA